MNNHPLRSEDYHSVERPWFWVSAFFILGIAAANQIKLPFFILYLLCLSGLTACLIFILNKRTFFLCLALSLLAFGFLRFWGHFHVSRAGWWGIHSAFPRRSVGTRGKGGEIHINDNPSSTAYTSMINSRKPISLCPSGETS